MKKVEIFEGNIGFFQFKEFLRPHVAGESMCVALAEAAISLANRVDIVSDEIQEEAL
ncbi:hypothetical protein [Ktedonospora formicarum]|uniref:Uncharacterized protein n=1 Tax=Ktedonospora formicarum TaxID=2778364 RepID=A0A8J3I3Z9_9CHLR|nr:hypothetical protein [Ktedonospora formicarum]GHO45772.1 hypothetical protein KSX_39350 [Ktedonospora formicarum]